MTPIPSSYLARDLYGQTWVEPDTVAEPPALPHDGERPRSGTRLGQLVRALDALRTAGVGRAQAEQA